MDRRIGGLFVVGFAVLAAAVLPAVSGRWLAGSASIAPIGGPPVPGACVTIDRNDLIEIRRAAAGVSQIPSLEPIPCDQSHDGEVVSVSDRSTLFAPPDYFRPAPDYSACDRPTRAYLGLAADAAEVVGSSGGARFAPWTAVGIGANQGAGPDARQRRAGQNWRACVLVSPPSHPYTGSARSAFRGGTMPEVFAACTLRLFPLWTNGVPCGGRHTVQIFGSAPLISSAAVLEATCRALVSAAMGRTDPTAGGALRVLVLIEHADGSGRPIQGVPSDRTQRGQAGCVAAVAGGRPLGHGLSGIGAGPLPWTG